MKAVQKRALIIDVLLIATVLVGTATVRHFTDSTYQTTHKNLVNMMAAFIIWIFCLFGNDCYDNRYIGSGVEETRRILKGSFTAFLVIGTLSFLFKRDPARLIFLVAFLVGLSLLVISRKIQQIQITKKRRNGDLLLNALVLGSTNYANQISKDLNSNPEFGYFVIGRMPIHKEDALFNEQLWLHSIDESIREGNVKALIIEDASETNPELISALSWHLNQHNVEVLIAPSFIKDFGPRLKFSPHIDLPLMYLDEPELTAVQKLAKRFIDVFVAATAIVVLLPLMLIIGLGIKISSQGPILFSQDRIGLAGKPFRFIKFRTMIDGAEDLRGEVLGKPDEEMATRYKHDPRIYPFGKLLRRFSLDEVPQLFSVLNGNMSLVGPRPLLTEELELLQSEDHRRHLAKPGLTGLWQISGRKETTWDERIQLDLQYVHNWSAGLDFIILLKTVKVVITGHGSY